MRDLNDNENIIHAYTADQAIEDGMLAEVGQLAFKNAKFSLGRLLFTPGAAESLDAVDVLLSLSRHSSGDWGNVCDEDKGLNDQAVKDGTRLMSAYHTKEGTKFWIITEADRSATTILLPDEY